MFDLEHMLLDAAKVSLGTLKLRKQKTSNKAVWFDNKCKAARNIFHKVLAGTIKNDIQLRLSCTDMLPVK